MDNETMERLRLFLKELAELTEKHGFEIGGCGCCGSPWVAEINGYVNVDGLFYDEHRKKYTYIGDREEVKTDG